MLNVITRTVAALAAIGLITFGFMGFAVAAMLHVPFPLAVTIAEIAALTPATFLVWMLTGMIGLVCFVFAVRS